MATKAITFMESSLGKSGFRFVKTSTLGVVGCGKQLTYNF